MLIGTSKPAPTIFKKDEAKSVRVKFPGRFPFLCSAAVSLLSLLIPALAAGQVPLIQYENSSGVTYQNSVSVTFGQAQIAGDLNVVVVGWNDITTSIASVQDSNGTYALAAGTVSTPLPTSGAPDGVSQAIYYFKNIAAAAAGANTVTVLFNSNTAAQDVRIFEYGVGGSPAIGLDTVSPLDTSVGASAGVAAASPAQSGPVTPNSLNDLIFGGGTIVSGFTGPVALCGTGCHMFGEPNGTGVNNFGDIQEDALVTTAGGSAPPYNAGAKFTAAGAAVMQLVAFRESGQTIPVFPAPTAASVLPATSSEAGGVAIAITGTNFLTGATVMFSDGANKASGVNCTVASATTINCLAPAFVTGTTPTLVVTNVDGQATTGLPFTFTSTAPFTTSGGVGGISPTGGATNGGTFVVITGSDFASGATVRVGTLPAEKVQVVNSNTIQAVFPAGSAGNPGVVVRNPSGANAAVPGGYTYSTGAGINFIQVNTAQPTSPSSNASAGFNLPQTAGDLNVVVIGWGDATSTVSGNVTDSAGNTYTLALATVGNGFSQSIYYAKNIKAATTNTVTVNFSQAAQFPDLRILEYSGVDTVNPLDGAAGASAATGTGLDSSPLTTTSAGDMILGAGDVGGTIISPGSGFATVIVDRYGNNVEHFFQNAAGPVDATATQDLSTAPWIMQGVAFRQPGTAVAGYTVSATPLAPSPVAPGGSATSTVSVTPSNGFTSAVALACTGLPAGATCAFVPPSVTPGTGAVTSVLTITTTAGTPLATSTVTITGSSGSVVEMTTVSLTVAAAGGPNFALTATALLPASVAPAGTATSTVSVTPSNGFTSAVTLTCTAGLPTGATCAFVPPSVTPTTAAVTSVLTITTTAATPAGTSTVTITGTAGSTVQTTTVSLTVGTAGGGNFTLTANPTSASVAAGASTTATITINATGGFTGTVSLACAVTPAATPAPVCSLPASATATATLTISTTGPTAARRRSSGFFYAMLLPLGGLTLLGAGFSSRRKKVLGLLLLFLVISGLVFMGACGGGSSSGGGGGGGGGTPAGKYTVTVTGTSGTLTAQTTTFSLTVQ